MEFDLHHSNIGTGDSAERISAVDFVGESNVMVFIASPRVFLDETPDVTTGATSHLANEVGR
jgi:hypothetical protein